MDTNINFSQYQKLLELFTTEYEKYFSYMDTECQKSLMDITPLVFAKWYHTALAEETILTPANIINMEIADETKEEIAHILHINPNKNGLQKYTFSIESYTILNHPLILDMQKVLDFCLPDKTVNENGFFFTDDVITCKNMLSFSNDFYLEYIMRLCYQLQLLETLPAIHTHKITKSKHCETFFAQDTETLLRTLIAEGCALTAERFHTIMHLETGIVDRAFFYAYLTDNQESDKIFIDFYQRVGMDLEPLWEKDPNTLSTEEQAIMSSFLFAGIMFDKWFITPMSLFFRVIRPIHFTPMRFYQTINNLSALLVMRHNIGAEIFTPPTYYSLTALGMALTAGEKISANKQKMPHIIPFAQLLEVIAPENELRLFEEMLRCETTPWIYTFHVVVQQDNTLWKTVEVPDEHPLHDFCCDICAAFCMEDTTDYVLSVPNETGFPMYYAPAFSKRAINKTNHMTLRDLHPAQEAVWALSPKGNKPITLSITLQKSQQGSPYRIYPRVKTQSEKISALEEIDELY